MWWQAEVRIEQRIACRDNGIYQQEAGVPMIWMHEVMPPRVVTEYDIRSNRPDHSTQFPTLRNTRFQLAIRPIEENHLICSAELVIGGFLLVPASYNQCPRIL